MKYDIIVIGAGPAGTTAGRCCALQGLKTLILEKEKLPRYKPCGGAVSTVAMSLLDFKLKNELIERECYGARVHYGHYKIEVKKPFRLSILTSRDKFDMYLAEKAIDAGVELKDDESVKSLDVQDSYVAVKTDKHTYKTFAVIGADGVNSVVATYVRPKYKPTEVALAIEASIPAKDEEIDNYIHDAIDIHFGLVRMGYGWVFPKRGHFSVGIAGLLSEIKNPRKVFENFLKELSFNTESRPYTHYAHRIPAGGHDRETCSDRIILVGDAAGYVDTFYGEGIAYAILSAKKAAETMVTAYEKNEFSRRELAKYKQECDETFGENLKYALEFSSLAHKYPDIFIKLLASNKSILDKYLEVPAGNMSYKEFKRWLLIRIPYYVIKSVMHL